MEQEFLNNSQEFINLLESNEVIMTSDSHSVDEDDESDDH